MSQEYCFNYKCVSSGHCVDEEITSCGGCQFLYDCEFCANNGDCQLREEDQDE